MNSNLKEIEQYLIGLQNDICDGLSSVDGESNFQSDKWERSEGGGGDTRVIKDGAIYEKGGVNFSHVFGAIPDFINETKKSDGIFHATGVSIVIHPQNPFVPIIHMNVRYFELRDKTDNEIINKVDSIIRNKFLEPVMAFFPYNESTQGKYLAPFFERIRPKTCYYCNIDFINVFQVFFMITYDLNQLKKETNFFILCRKLAIVFCQFTKN